MKTLNKNWLTEDLIDFEYKKYVILAYLQDIKEQYDSNILYPFLAEIIEHYRNLKMVKDHADHIKRMLPRNVKGLDLNQAKILYEDQSNDDALMRELESIIDYSIPLFFERIMDGKKIYDYVEKQLSMIPVGITPLRKEEGYLFIQMDALNEINVFQYRFSTIEHSNEQVRRLITRFISSYTVSLSNTYESLKASLIRSHQELPNPAVYVITSPISVPFAETLLPIAKRFFVTKIAA